MEFEKNEILFGADPTPRIVAIELGETGTVKVYRREKDGSTMADVEPFHPFVWADSDVVDLGIEAEKLKGDLRFGWLITVRQLEGADCAAQRTQETRGAISSPSPIRSSIISPRPDARFFKDLPFEELKRMQLEVLANDERIMSIALSDNTGWEELIIVDPKKAEESERNAIKQLTALITKRDPDVIEGHDLFRIHLSYVAARAKQLKTKLDWGRSGGFLRSRPSRLQIAEKTIDYPKFAIDGRHFVDTFLLAQFYDVGMRRLLASNGPTSRGILDFAMKKCPRSREKNWSVLTSTRAINSSDARSAACARPAPFRIYSARATSFRRKFFPTTIRT